jgi:hypothetical protein
MDALAFSTKTEKNLAIFKAQVDIEARLAC